MSESTARRFDECPLPIVHGAPVPGADVVLTPEALAFIGELEQRFGPRRIELLESRRLRRAGHGVGTRPDFLEETKAVRDADWRIAPVRDEIQDRRVEITGPVERKMIINALNSGANVFMADFEDSSSPTFANCVAGQLNLSDAVRGTIDFRDESRGKHYEVVDDPAVLFVRPRGWHLVEKHVTLDGRPLSASLFDFGLHFFHCARERLLRGSAPYFYLPKLESHLEARLWNDVFVFAQEQLGVPTGSIKATVLIETIFAAFEMDEILYELREHSAGLNCGRWDYIFSFIKCMQADPTCVLPDRATVGMDSHFLRSYSELLIKTCHRRGAFAMGGMAAQIPIKGDPDANRAALDRVRADKQREVRAGHDGTWVAHPGLIDIARTEFDAVLEGPNQLARMRADVSVSAEDLLRVPTGECTEAGLRQNLAVGIRYLEAWLRGSGCVPIFNLMEDAATAEISRTQLWQWRRHQISLSDGRLVSDDLIDSCLQDELEHIREEVGDVAYRGGRFELAAELFRKMILADELAEFLTLEAYEHL